MSTPQHGPQQPVAPPARKKSKFKVLLAIIGVAVLIAVIVNLTDNGESGSPGDRAVAPGPTAGAVGAGIGAPVRDGKFEFTVTGLERQSRIGSGELLTKQAQGEFLLVAVTVKNIGDQAQSFSGGSQKLIDAAGREYSSDSGAALYLPDSKSLYETINPGNQVRGVVIFDVPPDIEPAKVELHDSAFSNGVPVALK